jgi:chromosome partitioning protein
VQRIVIAAHKGGSGKTTLAVNLAGALGAGGRRVLLVDLDPQGAAGAALGVKPTKPSAYEVLMGTASCEHALAATAHAGLSVLPADLDLAGAEVELPRRLDWQSSLDRVLHQLGSSYDVCVIDTPPGLGVLSWCALNAAHAAVVTCPPEFLAFRSLEHLQEMAEEAGAPIVGIVPTMSTARTRHAREVTELLVAEHDDLVLPSVPRQVSLQDAAVAGKPITSFSPTSDVTSIFIQLADEVYSRVSHLAS